MNQNGAGEQGLVRLLSRGGCVCRAASRSAGNAQRVEEVAKINLVLEIPLAYRTALCANDALTVDPDNLGNHEAFFFLATEVAVHVVRSSVANGVGNFKVIDEFSYR